MNVSALTSRILSCPLAWNCTVHGSSFVDTKVRMFGVIYSHITAYSHVWHLQRWCPRGFGINAALPPAFQNRSSSLSLAPAAARTPTRNGAGLPGGTVGARAPLPALREGTIPQLAQASECAWDWDIVAYHVFRICGVCPASIPLRISVSSGNAVSFFQASECSYRLQRRAINGIGRGWLS